MEHTITDRTDHPNGPVTCTVVYGEGRTFRGVHSTKIGLPYQRCGRGVLTLPDGTTVESFWHKGNLDHTIPSIITRPDGDQDYIYLGSK